ncbi:MAG: hypothetical protein L0154_01800 [Chloroflexi bacterium]|nr:hypothetical protein [Chloroflexota bacterium]
MTTEAKCPLCSNTSFENIHINSASTGLSWMNRNYSRSYPVEAYRCLNCGFILHIAEHEDIPNPPKFRQ